MHPTIDMSAYSPMVVSPTSPEFNEASAAETGGDEDAMPISVAVRLCPETSSKPVLKCVHPLLMPQGVQPHSPQHLNTLAFTGAAAAGDIKEQKFRFDHVFPEHSSQTNIFDHSLSPLLPLLFDGYNITVASYGQAGSGKSYTLVGPNTEQNLTTSEQEFGLIIRSVRSIFQSISPPPTNHSIQLFSDDDEDEDQVSEDSRFLQRHQQGDKKFVIRVSFIDVGSDAVHDLLSEHGQQLKPRSVDEVGADGQQLSRVVIDGLTEVECSCTGDVWRQFERGSAVQRLRRASQISTKSHTIFNISVTQFEPQLCKRANLRFVEIASSDQMFDAACVNPALAMTPPVRQQSAFHSSILMNHSHAVVDRGLLTLQTVVSALGDPRRKVRYIPYTDSLLTHILSDAFGGTCVTLLICCVLPSMTHSSETLNTLNFASWASHIKNRPQPNVQTVVDGRQMEEDELELELVGSNFHPSPPHLPFQQQQHHPSSLWEMTDGKKSFQRSASDGHLLFPPVHMPDVVTNSPISRPLPNTTPNGSVWMGIHQQQQQQQQLWQWQQQEQLLQLQNQLFSIPQRPPLLNMQQQPLAAQRPVPRFPSQSASTFNASLPFMQPQMNEIQALLAQQVNSLNPFLLRPQASNYQPHQMPQLQHYYLQQQLALQQQQLALQQQLQLSPNGPSSPFIPIPRPSPLSGEVSPLSQQRTPVNVALYLPSTQQQLQQQQQQPVTIVESQHRVEPVSDVTLPVNLKAKEELPVQQESSNKDVSHPVTSLPSSRRRSSLSNQMKKLTSIVEESEQEVSVTPMASASSATPSAATSSAVASTLALSINPTASAEETTPVTPVVVETIVHVINDNDEKVDDAEIVASESEAEDDDEDVDDDDDDDDDFESDCSIMSDLGPKLQDAVETFRHQTISFISEKELSSILLLQPIESVVPSLQIECSDCDKEDKKAKANIMNESDKPVNPLRLNLQHQLNCLSSQQVSKEKCIKESENVLLQVETQLSGLKRSIKVKNALLMELAETEKEIRSANRKFQKRLKGLHEEAVVTRRQLRESQKALYSLRDTSQESTTGKLVEQYKATLIELQNKIEKTEEGARLLLTDDGFNSEAVETDLYQMKEAQLYLQKTLLEERAKKEQLQLELEQDRERIEQLELQLLAQSEQVRLSLQLSQELEHQREWLIDEEKRLRDAITETQHLQQSLKSWQNDLEAREQVLNAAQPTLPVDHRQLMPPETEVTASPNHNDHHVDIKSEQVLRGEIQELRAFKDELTDERHRLEHTLQHFKPDSGCRLCVERVMKGMPTSEEDEKRRLESLDADRWRAAELDAIVEAIDWAIDYKHDLILRQAVDYVKNKDHPGNFLMDKLCQLTMGEVRALLHKFIYRTIDLRSEGFHREMMMTEVAFRCEAYEKAARQLKFDLSLAEINYQTKLDAQQREHIKKLSLMAQSASRAFEGGGGAGDDRLREYYEAKLNHVSRDLKRYKERCKLLLSERQHQQQRGKRDSSSVGVPPPDGGPNVEGMRDSRKESDSGNSDLSSRIQRFHQLAATVRADASSSNVVTCKGKKLIIEPTSSAAGGSHSAGNSYDLGKSRKGKKK